jgi:hypothetical protein
MGVSGSDSTEDLEAFLRRERRSPQEVEAAVRRLGGHVLLTSLLEASDVVALVLNQEWEILLANHDALGLARARTVAELQGQRPGEAIGCDRAQLHPAGCGASRDCRSCGVANAIALSQHEQQPAVTECLLTVERNAQREAREFRVKAVPLTIDAVSLTVVSLRDISGEKRRDALERVFLHDLLNTISGLQGYTKLLLGDLAPRREILERVAHLSRRLTDEVLGQRALLDAERGELSLEVEELDLAELLHTVERAASASAAAAGRRVELSLGRPDRTLRSDRTLVTRVVCNMLKNALEATPRGGLVRLSHERDPETCRIAVWNAWPIPPEVAAHIFKRSFTTKGEGRGLGTYSMKLFGERYLGGRVSFTTSERDGTCFRLELPWLGPATSSERR